MGEHERDSNEPAAVGPRGESDDATTSDAGMTGDEANEHARPAIPDDDADED
ncbi:MAG TPA: hypothetical protein VK891_09220 [Euzebyales bacterium]|nr:hypothetical protein [Euzebyales bacterium]